MASPAQPLLNIRDNLQRGSQDILGGNWRDLLQLMLGHGPAPVVTDPAYMEQQRQNATHSFGMKYGPNDKAMPNPVQIPVRASRNLAGAK